MESSGRMTSTWILISYVATISLGGAVSGIDSGIIATTLAQKHFNSFMFPPGTKNVSSLIGAIVSVGSAGIAVGSLINGMLLEKLGRKKTIMTATFFTIIGATFQTAANGVPLMIVGRLVAGIALGILIPSVPVYISELAQPKERARLVGIYGFMVAVGFCLANWIGYACSYAKGNLTWRLGLAMQLPVAVILLILSAFLPESPRWLAQQERYTEFDTTLRRIYASQPEAFYLSLQVSIKSQIAFEAQQRTQKSVGHALIELFNRKNIKRTALAIIVLQVGILSGSLAIQNYQTILYTSLGFTGRSNILISGCYGFMGIAGQILNNLFVSDKWPRVRTMWIGCLVLAAALSILMALSKFYGSGLDPTGSRVGIAFIFLYSALYAVFFNSTLSTIAAELFPTHLRGYGVSMATFAQGVTAIWLGQLTPLAFAAIKWRYYGVFIGSLVVLSGFYATCLEETANLTLEEIAGRFGDGMVAGPEKAGVEGEEMGEHVEVMAIE